MKYRCDNCGSTAKPAIPWRHFPELGDIIMRLDPGGVVPAGECKCGALTYLVKAEPKPKVLLVIHKGALEAAYTNTEVELLLCDRDSIGDAGATNINRHYLTFSPDAVHDDRGFEAEVKRHLAEAKGSGQTLGGTHAP